MLQSCIKTTLLEEKDSNTIFTRQRNFTSKSGTLKEGLLSLQIQNNAGNTMLQIDSLEICNIQLADNTGDTAHNSSLTRTGSITLISSPMQVEYGSCTSTITVNGNSTPLEAKVPVQTFKPWSTAEHPAKSKNTYAKIHGTMYTYIANNTLFPLYTGTMYYPLSGKITSTDTNHITIDLQANCPLYAILNDTPQKVLQTISFTVTVNDWK